MMSPPTRPRDVTSNPKTFSRRSKVSSFTSSLTTSSTSPTLSQPDMGALDKAQEAATGDGSRARATQDDPPYGVFGQLSFAPATQTTVVVTTTTTTTKFPPFVMRSSAHLHNLDPKLYPLAASPTPQAVKRFCFDMDGVPTFFREADATGQTLQEIQEHHNSLDASGGVLQSTASYQSSFDKRQLYDDDLPRRIPRTSTVTPTKASGAKVLPSPELSINEAAKLARRHRAVTSQLGRLSNPLAPRDHGGRAVEQELSHPRYRVHDTQTPVTPDTEKGNPVRVEAEGGERLARLQQLRVRAQDSPIGLALESHISSDTSGKTPHTSALSSSGIGAGICGTAERSVRSDQCKSGEAHFTKAQCTPPPASMSFGHSDEAPEANHGREARPPRPSSLDTATAQDLSLPSPSLSPVTAAANLHQSNAGYFDDTEVAPVEGADCSRLSGTLSTLGGELPQSKPDEASMKYPQLPTPSAMDIPSMLDSFEAMPAEMKTYVMYQLLRRCPKPALQFVADVVSPALKCDFLALLPLELSLNIIKYLDVRSLCRAAQVSKRWRQIVDTNETLWKQLFDHAGFVLPEGELQRAIREGWGWQFGQDDCDKDISTPAALRSDSEWSSASDAGWCAGSNTGLDSLAALRTLPTKRPKRKAASKLSGRRQQKKREVVLNTSSAEAKQADTWMSKLAIAEGPYGAATAAALAVPYPNVGLSSLQSLHLYKSIYQRHHLIQKSWMQEDVKPKHIAFRAHQRHVVTCLQFDTDKILTGSDDTHINVYDTQTGALRARLQGHEGGVWALQYEGNTLVSGSTDRSVRVWDIEQGICTQVFQGHTSTVRCLQILMPVETGKTANGTPIMMPPYPLIITGSRDSNLRIWKLPRPGDPTFFQAGPPADDTECPYFVRTLAGHHHSVRAIAAHADTLVSGSYDNTVRVWKISNGETVHRLTGHNQKVYSIVLDHKRNRCISGSMDNSVKIWSLDTGSVLYNLEGHSSLVGLLDLNDDRLVSAAADSTLRIWDPENGQCKSTLTAHTGAITCFQHDGQKVISGSDRTLKMWNVKTGECVKDLLTDLSGVWQVKFNERRCVAAVQRNNLTYIEVLDFGAFRDGVPEEKRGKRIVVDSHGQEMAEPPDGTIIVDARAD